MAQKSTTRSAKPAEKKPANTHQDRQRRRQQMLFAFLAAIIILSWVVSLVVKF